MDNSSLSHTKWDCTYHVVFVPGQLHVIVLGRLIEVWDNTLVTSIPRRAFYWCFDIALREDDSRVRSGHAPAILAMLRRLAISLIKQDARRKTVVKASRKRAGWDLKYIKELLGFAVPMISCDCPV